MKKINLFKGIKKWIWFIFVPTIIIFLIMLLSGSIEFYRNVQMGAPLEEYKAHMDKRIPALMRRYNIPGCNIALVKDSEIAWAQSYGYADVASGRALTVDTPMSVQSITKSITAWGVMILLEKGLIDLDVPVSQYLNSWQFPATDYSTNQITVRQLLSHTSGMPLGDFTNIYSPEEARPTNRDAMTKEAKLIREPGKKFSYSNVGYNILEILIEDVTGQSFSDYIRTKILLPLGMNNSFFDIEPTVNPYPPTGYNLKSKPVPVYLYPSKGSGGLFATVTDIALFAIAEMNDNSVISQESINQMYQLECQKIGVYGLVFNGYGFGHYIENLPNGALSVSHGGQGNGIMTHLQIVPETKDAIVILTNSQRSWPFIAYILRDWGDWRGFSSVGMEKIIWGHYGLSVVIGLLISAIILGIFRLSSTIYRQKRIDFRLFRVIAAIIMLGILIWCICQDYLFITSVFPVLSLWLGGAVFVYSIVLLLSGIIPLLFPNNSNKEVDLVKINS
ncbi:MAG: serine hydrolase [Bacilli bacterium]|jgi:CubicO group peptidase (beta-lactamase class C family)|nr:serine hydrolase [Bacilli bacterium]HHU23656.1 serine hydrolase [Acholeplasmataceae bacterium]